MSFQETQPLSIEWFGGLNSRTPPNDLPPFAAALADNCVYPESGVASRPGFTQFAIATVPTGTQSPVNSLFVLTTKRGTIADRQLFLGFENGFVRYMVLDPTPGAFGTVIMPKHAVTPLILTGGQFYQRAALCSSGASGYGEFAGLAGGTAYGMLRYAAPGAPTVTVTAGTGACTAGTRRFALQVTYTDGTEGPLGAATSITALATDLINIDWTAALVSGGSEVASVSVWGTTVGDLSTFRRFTTIGGAAGGASFALTDGVFQTHKVIGDEPNLRSPKYPALAVSYAGRLGYFGEKHRAVAGWDKGGSQGTDFGFSSGAYAALVPGGWTVVSGAGAGVQGGFAAIEFDGVTAARSKVKNVGTVLNDLPGIARKNTSGWSGSFGVRIVYSKGSNVATGSLKFGLTGTTGSTSQTMDLSLITADTQYVAELLVNDTFSDDLALFYEGIGPGEAAGVVYVYVLECFDPTNTSHRSTVWWSEPLQLRAVNGLTGAQTFGAADGETAWLGFEWQGRFMVAKDSSLWVTQQSSAPPNEWPIEKLSDLIGVCGRRAIGHGPDFKILVNRGGCWLFQGTAVGPDADVANEISAEWAAINWAQAWQIWVVVDDLAQRIYLGVPTGTATYCNTLYVLDYSGGFGPAGEASGRRWSVWNVEARGGVVSRRGGQNQGELWIARDLGTSTSVRYLNSSAVVDGTADAIGWTYETGRIGAPDGAIGLYRRLALTVEGVGIISPAIIKADGIAVALPAPTLYTPMRGTQHLLCNVKDERVGVRLATSGVGARVHLHRLSLWMRRNPFGEYRARTP